MKIRKAVEDARYLWRVMREGMAAVKEQGRWHSLTGMQRLDAVLDYYHEHHATGCVDNPQACTTETVRAVNRSHGATVALLMGMIWCLYRWMFCASWWLPDL